MLLAVLSDTHSRRPGIEWALDEIRRRGAELILHCGDIEDADAVRFFPSTTHFVLGNCDWDVVEIRRAADDIGATLHESWGYLELAGKKIAFTHSHDQRTFEELEQADTFDFLFYGHTHVVKEHRTGRTRVINPGALHRAKPKSFILLDLISEKLERVVWKHPQ